MELCLKRGLVWEFFRWKLIILTAFFVNYDSLNTATILSPDKTAVGQVGVKNDKIDGFSNFNNKTFSHFEKDISLMEKSFT